MSGAARRRGRGRANVQQGDGSTETSASQPRRGTARQVPAGGFDGPASRGSASGTGTSGRRDSNPPSMTSGQGTPQGGFAPQGSQPGSRRSSISGGQTQPAAAPRRLDPALDPERVPRTTDALKNVDLPASFYEVDNLVSHDVSSSAHCSKVVFHVALQAMSPPGMSLSMMCLYNRRAFAACQLPQHTSPIL